MGRRRKRKKEVIRAVMQSRASENSACTCALQLAARADELAARIRLLANRVFARLARADAPESLITAADEAFAEAAFHAAALAAALRQLAAAVEQ